MKDSRAIGHAQLDEMAGGLLRTQLLYVLVSLRVPDLLAAGPRSAAALAKQTGADPDALFRVLRAASSLGVLTQDPADMFGATAASERLRPGSEHSLHAVVLSYGQPWWWATIGDLLQTVVTGGTAFDRLHGSPLFEWLAEHPDASEAFDANMTAMTAAEAAAVVAVAPLPQTGTVVDVAGGRGTLLAAILGARPDLRGVLVDLPHVAEHAHSRLVAAGVAERCRIVTGSFFEPIPAGGDLYILKDILHDWDDEHARAILRTVRAAISGTARLIVIERVIAPGAEPSPGKLVDVTMMLFTGGRERSQEEYERLLRDGGFRLTGVAPTSAQIDVICARPIAHDEAARPHDAPSRT